MTSIAKANRKFKGKDKSLLTLGICIITSSWLSHAGDWAPPGTAGSGEYTRASNIGSIVNTRHNLTQSFITSGYGYAMNAYRNQYQQVCVYCHTPHGASSNVKAPLWNRTVNAASSYTTYASTSLSQQAVNPGDASLTCLSCHDGSLPVDSIINMPGSGQYNQAQAVTVSNTFLDAWDNVNSSLQMGFGPNCGNSPCYHSPLGTEGNTGEQTGTCMECHNNGNDFGIPAFAPFIIGSNLTNDHPVGVTYPDPNVYDFQPGMLSNAKLSFFDTDGDNRADSNEIRLYNSAGEARVECASCHDPHGVEGSDGILIASFLRVKSKDSTICLSCHVK